MHARAFANGIGKRMLWVIFMGMVGAGRAAAPTIRQRRFVPRHRREEGLAVFTMRDRQITVNALVPRTPDDAEALFDQLCEMIAHLCV